MVLDWLIFSEVLGGGGYAGWTFAWFAQIPETPRENPVRTRNPEAQARAQLPETLKTQLMIHCKNDQ